MVVEDYRREYHQRRPYSKLGYQSPRQFAANQSPKTKPKGNINPSFGLTHALAQQKWSGQEDRLLVLGACLFIAIVVALAIWVGGQLPTCDGCDSVRRGLRIPQAPRTAWAGGKASVENGEAASADVEGAAGRGVGCPRPRRFPLDSERIQKVEKRLFEVFKTG